jgi:hypothetical protein
MTGASMRKLHKWYLMESYRLPLIPDGIYIIADIFRLYSGGGMVKLKPMPDASGSLRTKVYSLVKEKLNHV